MTGAEEIFKDISEAYEILSNKGETIFIKCFNLIFDGYQTRREFMTHMVWMDWREMDKDTGSTATHHKTTSSEIPSMFSDHSLAVLIHLALTDILLTHSFNNTPIFKEDSLTTHSTVLQMCSTSTWWFHIFWEQLCC